MFPKFLGRFKPFVVMADINHFPRGKDPKINKLNIQDSTIIVENFISLNNYAMFLKLKTTNKHIVVDRNV